ncbi:alpha-keto acid decarboxylase family protein [Nocardia jiangxiensis]|uniref:Alpha-keto-acid decarboxylase n=1 Tax=Nocardia jiangxiensis TaxID=282685 RepID=A0ABW6SDQ4_9NOCA|nr:thiamine pyrophosphate-binding protein [Nocardia jiangxiensis]
MSNDFLVGHYLLQRLRELGISEVFGVPGDYVLEFIDQISHDPDMSWVGNCNELNAAYAADGYARVKGAAAFVVTSGVGDLGAAGGVGGSYAENVPTVLISGLPGSGNRWTGRPAMHHSLGDGDFSRFQRMFSEITVAQTVLSADNAAAEIDRVLREAWVRKRPVFLALPDDVAVAPVARPDRELDLSPPACDPVELSEWADKVGSALHAAESPVVLVDSGVRQHGFTAEVGEWLSRTGLPWATTWAANFDLDKRIPGYLGTYFGSAAKVPAVAQVDNADVLIRIGLRLDEFSGGKANPDYRGPEVIDIDPVRSVLHTGSYSALPMSAMVTALGEQRLGRPRRRHSAPTRRAVRSFDVEPGRTLVQDRLWNRLGLCLREGDTVVVDTGTGNVGIRSAPIPDGVTVLTQNAWASIGWSVPALLGAQHANPTGRHILVVGDGALALTVQEISTMLTSGHAPLIVVLNNGGYLVEDFAGGRKMACNDIWVWHYDRIPQVFDGLGKHKPLGLRVRTEDDLERALSEAEQAYIDGRLALLEIVLDRDDAPRQMRGFAK